MITDVKALAEMFARTRRRISGIRPTDAKGARNRDSSANSTGTPPSIQTAPNAMGKER